MGQIAKLAPHDYAEVVLTKDGVQRLRSFPCLRGVVYNALGQIKAASHICFSQRVHIEGVPHPFTNLEPGDQVVLLAAFPLPPLLQEVREAYMGPDGNFAERIVANVPMDNLKAVVEGYTVNPLSKVLEHKP